MLENYRRKGPVNINLNCSQCDGNRLNLEEGLTDDSDVSCTDCGHKIGTLAELKERIAAEVLSRKGDRPALQPH